MFVLNNPVLSLQPGIDLGDIAGVKRKIVPGRLAWHKYDVAY